MHPAQNASKLDSFGPKPEYNSGVTPTSITESLAGGTFLQGSPSSIFTPEDFSSDELLMIETAEDFSRKEVLPIQDRLDTQEEGLMRDLVTKAGALGFCGPDTREVYGGLGLSKNLSARMLEFLSLNASFSVTIGITSGISQVGLQLFATDSLRNKYLPSLTSGEQIGAYCLSEPDSGTDALSMTTRAEEVNGKWILNGTKMWISNAKWADQFLVMAKVGGTQVTAFLVERGFPGVSISREEHKMGLKGSSTARVILEDAEIPLENQVYELGRGHIVAFNSLNLGRFKLASMSMGPAREALGLAAQYAMDRKQFGQPIGHFGLIQKKIAEMAARFYAAESMIYRTGANIDQAFESVVYGSPDEVKQNMQAAEEFSIECSMSKVFSTEAEAFIADEAVQVYGGYGFTEEFPVARIYRDCRISRIYEGTNEINRFFIADRIMKKVNDGKVTVPTSGGSYLHDLCIRGIQVAQQAGKLDQIRQGALADLAILHYAEQSARLRVRNNQMFDAAHKIFENWANTQATYAFGLLTGESTTVPAPNVVDMGAVADTVYAKPGPLA